MRLSNIDLRLLRVFEAVADAGGFVRAQDALGISQPAISAYIAKLEDRLNVRLCDRGPQGFALTPHGTDVLAEVRALLAFIDQSAARLSEIGKITQKKIRFGVVDSLTTDPNNPLAKKIGQLKGQEPDLQVQIGVYDYLDCLTELRAGRLDVAIVGIASDETIAEDLEAHHLFEEISGLFCAPGHVCAGITEPDDLGRALKAGEISAHSFLSNPIDHDLDLDLRDNSAEIAQGNIESTVYLTLAGTHVGLIPLHFAEHWVARGDLVPVAPEAYLVRSQIHAVRLHGAERTDIAHVVWGRLVASH